MTNWTAIKRLQLPTTAESRPIWEDSVDIAAINGAEFDEIVHRIERLRERGIRQNVLIEGTAGTGKSHLLGRVRRHVLRSGDIFVPAFLSSAEKFWAELAAGYDTALDKPSGNKELQRTNILRPLLPRLGLQSKEVDALLDGSVDGTVVKGLAPRWDALFGDRGPRNVALATVLRHSDDFEHREVAAVVLNGLTLDDADRRAFGFSRIDVAPRQIVQAYDRIIAEAGLVTVLGVDQLDALIANAKRMKDGDGRTELNRISIGLMDVANELRSTLVVLSCLIDTWKMIETEAIGAAPDRYPIHLRLGLLPSADAGRDMIAAMLADEFRHRGFTPPTPTWPFSPDAFETATNFTARSLIQEVNEKLTSLDKSDAPAEIVSLDGQKDPAPKPAPVSPTPPPPVELDRRFAEYRAEANHFDFDETNVDYIFPDLLGGALRAFAIENDVLGIFRVDTILESNPAVHGRLRYIVDAALEDEVHWSYRVILHEHYRAQQSRLQKADDVSGLGARRGLFILRNTDLHAGKKTQEIVRSLKERGGRFDVIGEDDLRTCEALTYMARDAPDGFEDWLRARRPASGIAFLAPILAHPELVDAQAKAAPQQRDDGAEVRGSPALTDGGDTGSRGSEDGTMGDADVRVSPRAGPGRHRQGALSYTITIGTSPRNGADIRLDIVDLRVHAAIFAGSGSGKTVLLRRIVEEAALAGVSSIVLDPNNDLARMGTPWPTAPQGWQPGDEERAQTYFDTVETVVYTPRIQGGRPLSFAPLAGLPDLVGDGDEFDVALDSVVALMAPRANLSATTTKGKQGRAVLKQALEHFVKNGGAKLDDFLKFLNEMPDHISDLAQAGKLSHHIAQTLMAETVNDPMFSDRGQAMDPGALLTPSPGKRARVSVISLIGLPGDELRQPFVSQLQMALFAWAKKNPAGDRPLTGLFVMDEAQTFAPSGSVTPSTKSTLALASQARKYGLGLLFATQAPKGIHNQITGNTGTQLFGRMVVSNQIATVKELAAAKGGTVNDIARLRSGEFYVGSVNLSFQRLDSPMCLSHHPSSPLGEGEIIQLAAQVIPHAA